GFALNLDDHLRPCLSRGSRVYVDRIRFFRVLQNQTWPLERAFKLTHRLVLANVPENPYRRRAEVLDLIAHFRWRHLPRREPQLHTDAVGIVRDNRAGARGHWLRHRHRLRLRCLHGRPALLRPPARRIARRRVLQSELDPARNRLRRAALHPVAFGARHQTAISLQGLVPEILHARRLPEYRHGCPARLIDPHRPDIAKAETIWALRILLSNDVRVPERFADEITGVLVGDD